MWINCSHTAKTSTLSASKWLGLQRLHSSRQMAIWSQINTPVNPFGGVQPPAAHNKATELNLHQLQRKNQPEHLCGAGKVTERRFGERPKTAGGSCMSMFAHTWKRRSVCQVSAPIDVDADGAWLDWVSHDPPRSWNGRVKVIRHARRYSRRAPTERLTRAADWCFVGPLRVSQCDKLRLQVACSPSNTTTYLHLTGADQYCKHVLNRGGRSVCVCLSVFQSQQN